MGKGRPTRKQRTFSRRRAADAFDASVPGEGAHPLHCEHVGRCWTACSRQMRTGVTTRPWGPPAPWSGAAAGNRARGQRSRPDRPTGWMPP